MLVTLGKDDGKKGREGMGCGKLEAGSGVVGGGGGGGGGGLRGWKGR